MIAFTANLPPSQLRIDCDRYKAEVTNYKIEVDNYKNEFTKLNYLLQQKDSEINNYKNQASSLNSQLSSVSSQIGSLNSTSSNLNNEIQNKNNIINNHVAKIGLLEGSNILLLQQIDELQLDKKDLRTDKVKLNEEVEILKNTILKKDLLIEEQAKEIEKLKKANLEFSFKSKLFNDETLQSILPNDIEESLLVSMKEENKSYSILQ